MAKHSQTWPNICHVPDPRDECAKDPQHGTSLVIGTRVQVFDEIWGLEHPGSVFSLTGGLWGPLNLTLGQVLARGLNAAVDQTDGRAKHSPNIAQT